MGTLRTAVILGGALALALICLASPAAAQKTDIIDIQRGSHLIGEIKGLQYGKLQLSTWAMSTVYIEWPRVRSISTDKEFEIELTDGTRFFGSVQAAQDSGSVVINYGTESIEVNTQTIVTMKRVKPNFWSALDGSIDLGVSFTQQNRKTDISVDMSLKYKKGLNNYNFEFSNAFSHQDSIDNISQVVGTLNYVREMNRRWFTGLVLAGERNSQLELEFRGTVGAGPGRFVVQTNKTNVAFWAGLAYARERYLDQDPDDTVPAFLGVEFAYWMWGELNRELASNLTVLPVLTGETRWRLSFDISLKWEIARHLYVNLSLNEDFDSNPPTETANKNSFYTTTSLGWTF